MHIPYSVALLLVLVIVSAGGKSLASNNLEADKYFDSKISSSDFPGVQYILLNKDCVLYKYVGGWADIASQKPMRSGTTMMGYSMTKTITAAAILQLYDAEKLDVDDEIAFYLPELPYKEPITIRQLLSHTSGLPNPIPLKWVHLVEEHPQFDETSALASVLDDNPDLSLAPGEKYKYSNIGYWLLGKVVEKSSGQSYEAYVKQHIFEPLQVSSGELSYKIPDIDNHAKGYLAKYSLLNLVKGFLIDEKLVGVKSNYEDGWLHIRSHYLNGPSFGGLIGSAQGFSNFLQDQLRPASVLLSSDIKPLFYQQQKTNQGDLIDMTLGWHIGYNDKVRYFYKEGGGAGYHSEMRIYPDQGIASVIMVNRTNFNSKRTLNYVDPMLTNLVRHSN